MESTDYHHRTACKREEAISRGYRLSAEFVGLDSLNVFGLQALGALGDAELYRLALLEALESARLDGREMHENIFPCLTLDEPVALRSIEPLHCALFLHFHYLDIGIALPLLVRFPVAASGPPQGAFKAIYAPSLPSAVTSPSP